MAKQTKFVVSPKIKKEADRLVEEILRRDRAMFYNSMKDMGFDSALALLKWARS